MKLDMAKNQKKTSLGAGADSKMGALSRSRAGQIVLVRILIILLVDLLVCIGMHIAVKGLGEAELAFHANTLPILQIVFGCLLVLAVVYLIITKVKKVDTSAYWVTPAMLMAAALYLTVAAVFYDRFRLSLMLFYTMTVIVSVLFAVYYVYTVLFYKK